MEIGTHPWLADGERLEAFVETIREDDGLQDLVFVCDVLVLSGGRFGRHGG